MSDFVPALAILCIFGLPIAAWIIFRVFSFLERMEMIKRGIVPPPGGSWTAGSHRVWREWARTQQQQGMPPGAPWQQQQQAQPMPPRPQAVPWSPDDDAQHALYKGIRLAMIGFAILVGLSFIGGTFGSRDFHGGPWLLGGLIPMFVGIAQIIIALLSGAQLPGVQSHAAPIPPGVMPPPSAGYTPGAGAPPWQQPTRPKYEELSKPVQPPDLR